MRAPKDDGQMASTRRTHTPAFKAKVALEALKEEQTLNQIGQAFEVHPVQVTQWRKTLLEGAPNLFERSVNAADKGRQSKEDEALRELGRLQLEVAFLKKKLQRCL